jgi:hypothetical protein
VTKTTPSKALGLMSGSFASLGVLALVSAPLLFTVMLLYWLKLGTWPDWSLAALGLTPPLTEYLGFNKILAWVYARELAGLSFGAGLLLVWTGLWLAEDVPA